MVGAKNSKSGLPTTPITYSEAMNYFPKSPKKNHQTNIIDDYEEQMSRIVPITSFVLPPDRVGDDRTYLLDYEDELSRTRAVSTTSEEFVVPPPERMSV